ncbi:hypothetical protein Ancab_015622 [Ancistrocladus abbreviatus]
MSWCKRSWITFVAPEKETAVSYSRVNLVTYHIMSRQLPLLPSTAFIAWVRTERCRLPADTTRRDLVIDRIISGRRFPMSLTSTINKPRYLVADATTVAGPGGSSILTNMDPNYHGDDARWYLPGAYIPVHQNLTNETDNE